MDSGLTAQEFAAEIGVKANTLAHWKWVLTAEMRNDARAVSAVPAGTGFVEVVVPVTREKAPPERSSAEPLEVVLPGGLVVRVPVHFDAASLRRVVDALGSR